MDKLTDAHFFRVNRNQQSAILESARNKLREQQKYIDRVQSIATDFEHISQENAALKKEVLAKDRALAKMYTLMQKTAAALPDVAPDSPPDSDEE